MSPLSFCLGLALGYLAGLLTFWLYVAGPRTVAALRRRQARMRALIEETREPSQEAVTLRIEAP